MVDHPDPNHFNYGVVRGPVKSGSAPEAESILLEAERLTSKDRQAVYGHPIEHFTRTAAVISAAFAHKLKEALTAEDWARIMILDKVSRSLGPQYKRDNMVDVAGYANTHEMVVEERGRRG